MYCNKCGKEIKDDVLYCGYCGERNRFVSASLYAKEYKNGNSQSFEGLYYDSYITVLNAIESKISNRQDIEDCVQKVYMKVSKKIDQYDETRPFLTWIYTIAKNTAIDELRKQGKQQDFTEVPLTYTDDDEEKEIDLVSFYNEFNPTAEIDKSEKDDIIHRIMLTLPDSSRECILLKYVEGVKIKDIASMLDIEESAVKGRISYGKKLVEKRVLEYESNGLKLYSMSPFVFFIWLLKTAADDGVKNYAAISASIGATATASSSVTSTVTSTGQAATSATVKVASGHVVKAAVTKKVVAIVTAVVVGGGVVAGTGIGVAKVIENKKAAEISIENNDAEKEQVEEEIIIVPDDKLEEKYKPVLDAYSKMIETGKVDSDYIKVNSNNEILGLKVGKNNVKNLKYTFMDLNQDKRKELIIAIDDEGYYTEFRVIAIYSYDNDKVFSLADSLPERAINFGCPFITNTGLLQIDNGDNGALIYKMSEDEFEFYTGSRKVSKHTLFSTDLEDLLKENNEYSSDDYSRIENDMDKIAYDRFIENYNSGRNEYFNWKNFIE